MSTLKYAIGGLVLCAALLFSAPGTADAHHRTPPQPTQQVVLEVVHPKTCCKIDVPVCVPVCCQGVPCVQNRHTLLGAGKTVFTWPCGYEVTVRFTHHGGYRVSTH